MAWPRAGTRSERPSQPRELVGDHQRGQGQRDEGGDPVPHRQARACDSGPTSATVPMSMPPGPGDGVLHLAAGRDDVEDLGADRGAVPAVLLGELPERRGVEVERLDVDPHLVGPQLGRGRRGAAAACGRVARPARARGAGRPARRGARTQNLPSYRDTHAKDLRQMVDFMGTCPVSCHV